MNRAGFLKRMAFAALASALFDGWVPGVSWAAPVEYPILHSDGITDDAPAIRAWLRGEPVWDLRADAVKADNTLANGDFAIGSTVDIATANRHVEINHNIFRGIRGGGEHSASWIL